MTLNALTVVVKLETVTVQKMTALVVALN